jgi:hypothetical protein
MTTRVEAIELRASYIGYLIQSSQRASYLLSNICEALSEPVSIYEAI